MKDSVVFNNRGPARSTLTGRDTDTFEKAFRAFPTVIQFVCPYVCVYVFVFVCVCACVLACVRECVRACVRTCMCVSVCVNNYADARAHTRNYAHTRSSVTLFTYGGIKKALGLIQNKTAPLRSSTGEVITDKGHHLGR